ncbi:MAG: hypothetical protein LBM98_08975 [Oscillospiraceae bacterium]|jgi:hypothetical protein|nr:hypothetical protein [Oscillospiraceae bacterium]
MPIERNRYFFGKLLTVRDFKLEQNYNELKRRLLNRLALGSGVICGLGVTVSDDATLVIESGMAIDYLGREILVPEALVRKLEMIDGFETLQNRDSAYLCLSYDEYGTEPVNAAGSSSDSREDNRIRESYKLRLGAEPPDYEKILTAQGRENVRVIYATEELTLVLSAPGAVVAGAALELAVLVIKNAKTPPLRFSLEWECAFLESGGKRLTAEFAEAASENATVRELHFSYPVTRALDTTVALFPVGIEMNIELGSWKYKNFIQPELEVRICASNESLREYRHIRDSLNSVLISEEIPIYLAKLELISAAKRVFINSAFNLPFGQLFPTTAAVAPKSDSAAPEFNITTAVKTIEYSQNPEVKVANSGGDIHFEFSLPATENRDFRTSHGYVDIAMPGGLKVNAKYYSDEISHGLGPGNVNLRLAIEFRADDGDTRATLFGNSEIFRSKQSEETPPRAEAAAIVYPDKGTMRIGVWIHDDIFGSSLRVRYFADKSETRPPPADERLSIEISPEVLRLKPGEQRQLHALIKGAADKAVIWSVQEDNGGEIDAEGNYKAPEARGTYEVIAKAAADVSVHASAFVIVM